MVHFKHKCPKLLNSSKILLFCFEGTAWETYNCSNSLYMELATLKLNLGAAIVLLSCRLVFNLLSGYACLGLEFVPNQKLSILRAINITLVSQNWLVPGTDSGLIYVSRVACLK